MALGFGLDYAGLDAVKILFWSLRRSAGPRRDLIRAAVFLCRLTALDFNSGHYAVDDCRGGCSRRFCGGYGRCRRLRRSRSYGALRESQRREAPEGDVSKNGTGKRLGKYTPLLRVGRDRLFLGRPAAAQGRRPHLTFTQRQSDVYYRNAWEPKMRILVERG
jgi:hypothetical protein